MTKIYPQHENYRFARPDRREVKRVHLASLAALDSSKWDLELSLPADAPELERLLQKYHSQHFEENLFFDQAFLVAAFGRMNASETSLITVWETIDSERYLRMYFPIISTRLGLAGKKVWQCWSHSYAPLGVPIVQEQGATETLNRFLQLLARVHNPRYPTLVFPDLPLDNTFAAGLRTALSESKTPFAEYSPGERGILLAANATSAGTAKTLNLSAKMIRKFRRQRRRLDELGDLTFERVTDFNEIVLRFEEFLLLETKGWKGRKGTSLHTVKQTAAFARQAVTDMAKHQHSSIYSIRLDDRSIASLIVLHCNGVYFPWKIAFDQDYAHYSPGSQLMYRVSQSLLNEPDFVRADSLASTSNQLINPLWKQRMRMGALILPIGNTNNPDINRIASAMATKDKLRDWLKSNIRRERA